MRFLFLFFILTGCSTWDREKCLTTNWYDQGREDAAESGIENFPAYKRECGKEGIGLASKEASYRKGFLEGLRSWCTFQNGFNQGLSGKVSTTKCDAINPAFARGLEEGYREFRVTERRKRDEEERDKRYAGEKEDFRRRILRSSDTRECAVDSDCVKPGECRYSRCTQNGQACTMDHECKTRGWCREVSETNRERTVFSVRVCDFGSF